MKKLLATMLTILTCGAAYALPVGNPADPILLTNGLFWDDCYEECYDPCDPCGFDWGCFSFRFGYYGDFVFDRRLERRRHNEDVVLPADDRRHGRTEMYTNAGLIAVDLWDRLDIFATLGGTKFHHHSGASIFGLGTGRLDIETDTSFSWSVGAQAVLWECGCTVIGLEGQYFRTRSDVRRLSLDDTFTDYPDGARFHHHEWQVGLGIAHRINMFVPYFAVKWSKVNASFSGLENIDTIPFIGILDPRLGNKSRWGYAFGVSLVDCDIMSLNVEGRLGDERAVAVNAQIRF